ncbi:MAG: 2OG-Fe dioxygenase family protein [Symploca sp. SIO2E6]|nr:2OG-Fe dioxygenase family protein [Symploca sp. SIO2E6]
MFISDKVKNLCWKNYHLDCVEEKCLQNLQHKFDSLPLDRYIKGFYRYRRFSRFSVSGSNITRMPHATFYQNLNDNKLLGGIQRSYQELKQDLVRERDFVSLLIKFSSYCQTQSESQSIEIGVHQIRITCSSRQSGNPTPEGIHRDGVDTIGILCVNRHEIKGGITSLFYPDKKSLTFKRKLHPGELLIVNDKQLWHYTSPITPVTFSNPGFRDILVLTYSSVS